MPYHLVFYQPDHTVSLNCQPGLITVHVISFWSSAIEDETSIPLGMVENFVYPHKLIISDMTSVYTAGQRQKYSFPCSKRIKKLLV